MDRGDYFIVDIKFKTKFYWKYSNGNLSHPIFINTTTMSV